MPRGIGALSWVPCALARGYGPESEEKTLSLVGCKCRGRCAAAELNRGKLSQPPSTRFCFTQGSSRFIQASRAGNSPGTIFPRQDLARTGKQAKKKPISTPGKKRGSQGVKKGTERKQRTKRQKIKHGGHRETHPASGCAMA